MSKVFMIVWVCDCCGSEVSMQFQRAGGIFMCMACNALGLQTLPMNENLEDVGFRPVGEGPKEIES